MNWSMSIVDNVLARNRVDTFSAGAKHMSVKRNNWRKRRRKKKRGGGRGGGKRE